MSLCKWLVEAVYDIAKWIVILITKLIKLIIYYICASIGMMGFSFAIVYMCWKIYDYDLNKLKQVSTTKASQELQDIFNNVARITEVTDRIPPLGMWASMQSFMTVNAFTTGEGVYVTYLANSILTTDEKALVLGHEMAHVILHHTDNAFGTFVSSYSSENELMADNLGATWADKAGYNVCKGREVFMKFYLWEGNSLNGDHPPNTLRYENLEHYCHKTGAK
jgi:Zn-dependent protease with chaperone function